MESSRDLIATLGYLCLGSRLKRLGERMQAGVAQQLATLGHDVQTAQLPVLYALRDGGAMTVGALSERLGVSQPGVSRLVAVLEKQRLVTPATMGKDRRQRQIALSAQGEALMADLAATLFPAVREAVERLCVAAGPDLLDQIDQIEDDLATVPLDARIGALLGKTAHG